MAGIFPRHFFGVLVVVSALLAFAAVLEASDSFIVNFGANSTITAFSTCKKVTNNSATGLSVYVPTQTSAEWSSFYTNSPSGVTIGSCGIAVTGWKTDTGAADWLATGSYDLNTPQGWVNTGSTMPSTSDRSQVAVIGSTIYLFGGSSSARAIYSAPVSNPTSWTNTGALLPIALSSSQLAVIGNYVYLFGGWSGMSQTNKIFRAPTSNPTAWVDTGATLPSAIRFSQVAVIGSNVYLYGGYNGATTNVIYRAPVSDPLTWTNTGATLPTAVQLGNVVVVGNTVYYLGGSDQNSNPKNIIWSAPISNPTAITNTGATLPVAAYDASAAVLGNHIYIFGGMTSSGGAVTNQILSALVSSPTNWTITSSTLPIGIARAPIAIVGSNIYLFGGMVSGLSTTAAIYRAPLSGL